MIKGIGVDLCDVDRIERSWTRFGLRFAEKILADEELLVLKTHRQPVAYLAKRFAAKEAVSKALGTGMQQGVHFRQIVIRRRASGAPIVHLEGKAASVAGKLGFLQLHLSLSDEKNQAIAFVVGEG